MPIRAVVMFAAGAIVGYCLVAYYAELLWVGDATSGQIATFLVAPAGALICGLVSAIFARGAAIFAAATVIGYLCVAVSWFSFADVFGIGDREGGKGMGMIFIFAPAGGAMIGLIAAGLLGWRTGQVPPTAPQNTQRHRS
jgi:hypothetical protein